MLVDTYGEIADNVFIEAQQALDLNHRLGRRGNVQKREMSLAVLLDAEGKRLQAPRLNLGDGAAERSDLRLDFFRQRLDLLLRDVLARQEDMLIESHCGPFHFDRVPRGALRARERLERSKAGTREDGRPWPCRTPAKVGARPSVQPPAGRNEAALIQRVQARGKEKSILYRAALATSWRPGPNSSPSLWLPLEDALLVSRADFSGSRA